jgi:transketolase C-terminal domain/subunit
VLAEAGTGTRLKRLGLQDVFACMVGSHQDLKERFGITAETIVKEVHDQLDDNVRTSSRGAGFS